MSGASPVQPALFEEVRRFLHREARLIDERRFVDWLALFASDATYWVPRQRGQSDALVVPSIVYEDRPLLAMRVERLMDPQAHAAAPIPWTLHILGNIDIVSVDGPKEEYSVASAQLVVESRNGSKRLHAGTCEHLLRRRPGGFSIAAKRIDLIDCDAVQFPMTIIL